MSSRTGLTNIKVTKYEMERQRVRDFRKVIRQGMYGPVKDPEKLTFNCPDSSHDFFEMDTKVSKPLLIEDVKTGNLIKHFKPT